MTKLSFGSRVLLLSTASALILSGQAAAQEQMAQEQGRGLEEVVVTARKRDETAISVPVAVTALGAAQMERLAVNNFDDVARFVPGLVVGEGGGTLQGGEIAIRGIGGADANPFADQAVSFNIDGVQVAQAFVRRMAEMDVDQVEVLKGPQALFFGKNSPAGVVSVRSADPTSTYSGKISTGYEFIGHESRTDGFVAGPITDKLGGRLAFYGSSLRGWSKDLAQGSLAPDHRWGPETGEYAFRGTLKYAPNDKLTARAKFTYNHVEGDSIVWNDQLVRCPTGTPQTGSVHECRADDRTETGYLGPNFGKVDPRFGDGKPYLRQSQMLGGFEVNYDPSENMTLTSVTGFYQVQFESLGDFTVDYAPATVLASQAKIASRQVTEEIRLTSRYNGPVNFMLGTFYQDSKARNRTTTYFNALNPAYINNYHLEQVGHAYSVFGQLLWNVIPTLELSAGGRYSFEDKALPVVESGKVLATIIPPTNNGRWNNFSPEFTATWRPDRTLTVYASYKRGFLSGGFNAGAANFAGNLKYDQETIRGWEIGTKAALFDEHLRVNLAAYKYTIAGLQTTVTTQNAVQFLTNAGEVSIEGFELDGIYKPPVAGLTISGDLAYNNAIYERYIASCYKGQTIALGCNVNLNPATGLYTSQNLAGGQLLRAPRFSGNFGVSYDRSIGMGLRAGASGDVTLSGSYLTDATSTPNGREPGYALVDATLHLAAESDQWEVALIGRNLTDRYYWVRISDNPFSGTNPGSVTGRLGDTAGVVSRGREVMLRGTFAFGM